jgi:glycosyltransferase involved in cell wall biosynthesis
LDPDRIHVVHLGVADTFRPVGNPTTLHAVRVKYGIHATDPYILNVANIQPRKNLGCLIEAFARLTASTPDQKLRLVLAGERTLEHMALFSKLDDARVKHRVHFTGYVAEEDMSALLSGAEVFAFPSNAEGFGLPPLEAMACGTAVVVANSASLPEVVGEDGLYCEPRSPESLCSAIQFLLANPERKRNLEQAALKRARRFTWRESARKLADVYSLMATAKR